MPPRKKADPVSVHEEHSNDENPFQSARSQRQVNDLDDSEDDSVHVLPAPRVRHRHVSAPPASEPLADAPKTQSHRLSYRYILISVFLLSIPLLMLPRSPSIHCLLGPLLPSPHLSKWTSHCPYAIPPAIRALFLHSPNTESLDMTENTPNSLPLSLLTPVREYHPILSHLATKTPFKYRPALITPPITQSPSSSSSSSSLSVLAPRSVAVLARHGSRQMTADHAQRAMRAFLRAVLNHRSYQTNVQDDEDDEEDEEGDHPPDTSTSSTSTDTHTNTNTNAPTHGHALRLLAHLAQPAAGLLTAQGRREGSELGAHLGLEWASERGAVDPERLLGPIGTVMRAEARSGGGAWCTADAASAVRGGAGWGPAWTWLPDAVKIAVSSVATHKHRARETRAAAMWGVVAGICMAGSNANESVSAAGSAQAGARAGFRAEEVRARARFVPAALMAAPEAEDDFSAEKLSQGPVVELRETLGHGCELRSLHEEQQLSHGRHKPGAMDLEAGDARTVSACVWRRAALRFFEECGASVLRPKMWVRYAAAVEGMVGTGAGDRARGAGDDVVNGGGTSMSRYARDAVEDYCKLTEASELECENVRGVAARAEIEVDALLWKLTGDRDGGAAVTALARHLDKKIQKKSKKNKKDKDLKATADKSAKKHKKLKKIIKALSSSMDADEDDDMPATAQGIAAARSMVLGWVRRLCEGDAGAGVGESEDGWCALLGGADLQESLDTMITTQILDTDVNTHTSTNTIMNKSFTQAAARWGSGRGPSAVAVLLEHAKDVKARWKKGPQGREGIGAACVAVKPLLGMGDEEEAEEAEVEMDRVRRGWGVVLEHYNYTASSSADGAGEAGAGVLDSDLLAAVFRAIHRDLFPCPESEALTPTTPSPLVLPAGYAWCRVSSRPLARVSVRVAHAETLLPVLALLDPGGAHTGHGALTREEEEELAGKAPPAPLHRHPEVANMEPESSGESRRGDHEYYRVGALTPMAARVEVWRYGSKDEPGRGRDVLMQLRVNGDPVPWPCADSCSRASKAISTEGKLLEYLCPENIVHDWVMNRFQALGVGSCSRQEWSGPLCHRPGFVGGKLDDDD